MLKFCPNCKENLIINYFGKNKSRPDGRQGFCKKCRRILSVTKYKDKIQKYGCGLYSRSEKVRNDKKEYYNKNKVILIQKITKRTNERLKNDPIFRLTGALRSRVRQAIKNQGGEKSHKTISLIGCSIPSLTKHLESLWTEGMTWENYGSGHGKWVIDHILPCISFDLSSEEEQKKCFNYKNMQPLWWKDNASKSDKIINS